LSAFAALKTLNKSISVLKTARLFTWAGAATTGFQLAFPGKVRYRTAVSAKICGLIRSLTLRLEFAPCWCYQHRQGSSFRVK
jgi:hypothetical protein